MTQTNQTKTSPGAIAAIDVGYGQVKAMISPRQASAHLESKKICFPRVIAPHQGKKWSSIKTATVYCIEDEEYILGHDARAMRQHILSDQAKDYIHKPTYWLMIGKALHDMAAFNGSSIANGNDLIINKCVLGLAPGHHTDEIESKMRKKLTKGFSFAVKTARGNEQFSVKADKVYLLPQGAGPYYKFLIDQNGKVKKHNNGATRPSELLYGIIDIGHETSDYVVFEHRHYVTPKENPSEPNGVRYVLEKILEHVKEKYGYTGERSEMLVEILQGKPFFWKGDHIDLTKEVTEIVQTHVHKNIVPNIMQRWQSFMGQMNRIFICGGGASMIKTFVPEFLQDYKKQIVLCDEPETSNIVGFHRFALLKDLAETQQFLRGFNESK